jgi:RNA polymerase primary sigma factor
LHWHYFEENTQMHTRGRSAELDGFSRVSEADSAVLSGRDEREILRELAECRRKLAEALASMQGIEAPASIDDPREAAAIIALAYAGDGPNEARLGAVHRRYSELRDRLAMANLRLVAHVAKRFRDRGIPYADLLQEGFCGLLAAIDRFDTAHPTKLATYATWWIRHAIQNAVASGAYPVRLSPRHLRQLSQNQDESSPTDGGGEAYGKENETIQRIRTATRPTVSLDARLDDGSSFSLTEALSDGRSEGTDEVDPDDGVDRLLEALRPRERQVLRLRFGLEGDERLSLSQVGRILDISKERVRQIQDSALKRLRSMIAEGGLVERFGLGL